MFNIIAKNPYILILKIWFNRAQIPIFNKIINNNILISDTIFHNLTSLTNIGLTCYMNAAFQVIFRFHNYISEILLIDISNKNKIITESFIDI